MFFKHVIIYTFFNSRLIAWTKIIISTSLDNNYHNQNIYKYMETLEISDGIYRKL